MDSIINVENSINDFIKKIDIEMNSRFNIVNSKTRTKEKFESEKLIYSLTYIGIPLTHTLKILNIVTDNIIKEHKKREVETFEIRKVVRNSLYALHSVEEIGVDAQQCQIWGDVYLRKYGNPEGPLEIIHRDGEFEKLDYKTLQDKIIPEVFADILHTEKSKILETIPKKERIDMGNELMRAILDLGIYRIHHRTLLLLTKDIAMQPPHPWVINSSKSFEYIKSDLEKADKHLKDIKSFYNEGKLPYCRNSIREFIHHVSAAVLGYYNEISGCGELSAFYNLINVVNKIIRGNESDLFEESKIQMIKQDLSFCNLTLLDFSEFLKDLKHYLHIIHRDEIIEEMIPLLEKYLSLCKGLVSGRIQLRGELECAINCRDEKLKGQLFEGVVKKIFELSKCFTVRKNVKRKNKEFDLVIEHGCKSKAFSEIKKYVYVECKNTARKADVEVVEKLGKRIEDASDRFCNTGIIISAKGFTKGAIDEAISYFDKDTVIILLQKGDLSEMIKKDIIKELETKIDMLFYGKVEY